MRLPPLILLPLLAAALALPAQAKVRSVTDPDLPRSLPDSGAVSVSWTDPAQFTEIRYSGNRWEAKRGDWVRKLAEHVRESASERLPPGERLEVTITDIERAGDYEPWLGINAQDIRILRDIYPPRITLEFKHYGADGRLIEQGERKLRDAMYLSSAGLYSDSDPLRFEKRLIDNWIRRDLAAPQA